MRKQCTRSLTLYRVTSHFCAQRITFLQIHALCAYPFHRYRYHQPIIIRTIIMTRGSGGRPLAESLSPSPVCGVHRRVMQKSDTVQDVSALPSAGTRTSHESAACEGIICQTCQGDSGATVARPNEASRNSSARNTLTIYPAHCIPTSLP